MIYSYGCSFSTQQLVPTENFWLDILAKHYDSKYESWGSGGSEYHEAYHRMLGCLHEFKKGDLIVFQFTEHFRVAVMPNNYYLTTAMLSRSTQNENLHNLKYLREFMKIDKTDEDFLSVWQFSNIWSDSQMFYHYWRVWNLLTYLKETVGIEFIFLFLDQMWMNIVPKEHYSHIPLFPVKQPYHDVKYEVKDPSKNVSLGRWCLYEEVAIMHEEQYFNHPSYHPQDGHPGDSGNRRIAETIINHIADNWEENNPYYKPLKS